MGLCKCPKKKLTNQFCFEHRVNVCEHCMVADHSTCVVRSYLHWLNDSDYNPVCTFCNEDLAVEECIRLVCYDVFHKKCLNAWASRMPASTAPAGYKCPTCPNTPIFPRYNVVSPIAEALKNTLAEWSWARAGLGLPLIKENVSCYSIGQQSQDWSITNGVSGVVQDSSSSDPQLRTNHRELNASLSPETFSYTSESSTGLTLQGSHSTSNNGTSPVTAMEDASAIPTQLRKDLQTSRKPSVSEAHLSLTCDEHDADEDKYKRRPTLEWFSRWWRTMSRPPTRHHQGLLLGKRRMLVVLIVLGVLTVIVVLSYFSHNASEDDPMLDPLRNPNIRIEGI